MAGQLLLVVLMYSFAEMKAQALPPPTLTVNPSVITETDSVTLNCQTPTSVSVSQCYFYTVSGGNVRGFSCQQTLTGTYLLKMTSQSSPAEVKMKCFYTEKLGELDSQSPHSDTSSIIIHTLPPPTLTVNPSMITETDSVTMNCQTPSSVSVSQCYFYTVNGGNVRIFSCQQTLTGTYLLKMTHQSSPAEVKVKCYYTVMFGEFNSQSPHSDTSSIIINTLPPPTLTVNPSMITETDSVTLNCQTPSSVSVSQCYFYTVNGGNVRIFSCQQTLTGTYLLKMTHQSSPAEVKVKCYYTVKLGEFNSLSPYSDTSSIFIHKTDSMTPMTPKSGDELTGLSVSTPGIQESSVSAAPLETASEMWIWTLPVAVAGCGATVGIILLISAVLWKKRKAAGSEEETRQESQNENYDTYHLYSTISEEPASTVLKDMMYSSVQAH
ncbi:uncharacterized protein LOC121624501 isoform X3 [Chelmon rostratus]|uniref:uncharacterized protein LOC121624501 isoform X3 n=1 Tax=Chelmon rostratus TaxID=109905 RepID=UPI001BEA7FFE|nr:uncharacterized protein LOC121624501 isoform X3 [Chelmon rostratus]